jgi:hypothetical protein
VLENALRQRRVSVGEAVEDLADLVGTTRDVVVELIWVLDGETIGLVDSAIDTNLALHQSQFRLKQGFMRVVTFFT